jgi:hypothetical protein
MQRQFRPRLIVPAALAASRRRITITSTLTFSESYYYPCRLLGRAVWRIADLEIRGARCAATDFCKLLSIAAASRTVPRIKQPNAAFIKLGSNMSEFTLHIRKQSAHCVLATYLRSISLP